eukprot:gnl/TRDRNA2_/TRDRNA2_122738_c0_seq1.p1 gnl/TRDRNA2_/TRDRNA2_122738_c0~~gnl/TRDRNA2_/TRDRNA2_122738_c0_seq1.p1  ORF type:complete len:299 (-),score=59.62 gnl/TRDRNA2_/TRDRNA2_122738_c0_seq1:419-1249(-)
MSGDDYGDVKDTPMMKPKRWMKRINHVAQASKWGVISALHEFTKSRNLELHVTWAFDCYKYPAWYFVKPPRSQQGLVVKGWPTAPVPCRDDLAWAAQNYFVVTGKAAEIGVYKGALSARMLRNWKGEYYMIDAWQYQYKQDVDQKATNQKAMDAASKATESAEGRRHLIQALSGKASEQFESGSLDWIHIGALHGREALLHDLKIWYPKVREGGLVSGDDYEKIPEVPMEPFKKSDWGVADALHEFMRSNDLELHVTWLPDCYKYPSWYFVKRSRT